MKHTLPTRPPALKIAVLLASAAIILGLAFSVLNREAFADAWILVLAAQSFVAILYMALFIMAFNGSGWVRYVYTGLFLIGLVRYAGSGLALLLNPWMVGSVVLNTIAIAGWFFPSTTAWYREVKESRRAVDTE